MTAKEKFNELMADGKLLEALSMIDQSESYKERTAIQLRGRIKRLSREITSGTTNKSDLDLERNRIVQGLLNFSENAGFIEGMFDASKPQHTEPDSDKKQEVFINAHQMYPQVFAFIMENRYTFPQYVEQAEELKHNLRIYEDTCIGSVLEHDHDKTEFNGLLETWDQILQEFETFKKDQSRKVVLEIETHLKSGELLEAVNAVKTLDLSNPTWTQFATALGIGVNIHPQVRQQVISEIQKFLRYMQK